MLNITYLNKYVNTKKIAQVNIIYMINVQVVSYIKGLKNFLLHSNIYIYTHVGVTKPIYHIKS